MRTPLADRLARHDLLGRETVRQRRIGARDRGLGLGPQPVLRPVRARRDHHLIGAVVEHVVRRHVADAEMNLDVPELGELELAVADDPAPLRAARVARDVLPETAELALGLAQMHVVAALSQYPRALHAGGPAAHHENRAGVRRRRELLGMPAAAILLHRGGVLGAVDLAVLLELGHAHVAADALADVLGATLLDLSRQEGIGDGGPRRPDDVALARVDDAHHVVRAGEAAVVDHRYAAHHRLDLIDERSGPVGLAEARAAGVFAGPFLEIADLGGEHVDHAFPRQDFAEADPLVEVLDAPVAARGVEIEAGADGAVAAALSLERTQDLDGEARTVLQRAAVAVAPVIVAPLEELHGDVAVAADHLEDVEARLLAALGGFHVHLDERLDVVRVGLGAVDRARAVAVGREVACAARHLARFEAGRLDAAVPELDSRQGAVTVKGVAEVAQIEDVAFVPEARGHVGVVVRFRMDGAEFREHGAPPAFCLHASERRLRARTLRPRTRAMRCLPESVLRDFRTHRDGFEQDVVLGITWHEIDLPCFVVQHSARVSGGLPANVQRLPRSSSPGRVLRPIHHRAVRKRFRRFPCPSAEGWARRRSPPPGRRPAASFAW